MRQCIRNKNSKKTRLLFIMGFMVFPLLSHAAQPFKKSKTEELRALSIEELMNLEIHSVSKFPQTLENAPASVLVITHDQIISRGYFDLSDVLRDLPGIDLVDNARGFGEFYTLHGIEGNDRFLVFVDNQKLNPVSGTFLSIGNSISIRFAERIEIVLGPASALYGADALSGIIHIYNRKSDTSINVQAYGAAGSRNTQDGGVSCSFQAREISFRIQARFYNSDGPDFLGKYEIYDSIESYQPPLQKAFEQPVHDRNLDFQANYKDWTFSCYSQKFNEGNAFGQHPRSNIYNPENKWETQTDIFSLKNSQDFGSTGLLDARLSFIKHVQDPDTQFYKTLQPYAFDQLFSQYMTGEDTSWQSEITFFRSCSENFQFVAGVEGEMIESIPPYANDQVIGSSVQFEGNNARLIRDELTVKENRTALFTQINYQLRDRWTFILGGRFDDSDRHDSSVNPRVGLIFKPGSETQIKAFYGTAFQAPSLFLQYEQWGSINAVMLSVEELQATNPGWELENQENRSMEISMSHIIQPFIRIQCSVYQHHLRNVIERVLYTNSAYNKYFSTPDNPVYSLGFRNENIGTQKIQGLDLQTTLSQAGSWEAYFWYSYTDAKKEIGLNETAIPRIAKHKAAIGLTSSNLFGFLGVSMKFKCVGPVNNRNTTVFPAGTQPGYNQADLFLTAAPSTNSRIFLRIQNVFDKRIEHGGLFDQEVYLPTVHQPGLTATAGFEYVY